MKKIIIWFCAVYVLLVLTIPVSATIYDIYPNDSEGTVYNIMKSQAQPGDTLYFHAGTYDPYGVMGTRSINIENVTWKGESADVVTLELGTSIDLTAEDSVLDGFTVISSIGLSSDMSPNCNIKNCIFNGVSSSYGVSIEASNTTFENNIISNATEQSSSYVALSLTGSEAKFCTIINNTFVNNNKPGIFIANSASSNIITGNNFTSNGEGKAIGFYNAGKNNSIYLNNIGTESAGTPWGGSIPTSTYWNSTKPMEYSYNGTKYTAYMGNFWNIAYTGSDTNANGIGDTYYTVPSSLGIDYAPLITGIENYNVIGEVPDSTVLSFDPGNTSVIEEKERQIQIMADAFPRGLSKYNLTVNINNPDAVEIRGITYPSWASDTENSSLPGTSVYLKACENESAVQKGAKNVVLVTLTVYGKEFGAFANLSIGVEELKDDSNDTIETTNETCKLKVTMKTLPVLDSSLEELSEGDFYTSSPQDLDGDGLYEDLNGDGEFMFADIVTYFHDMNWIEENLQKQYFDFNGNQNIDYDDVRTMFKEI
jgi:parallel beta-helix repeat protein